MVAATQERGFLEALGQGRLLLVRWQLLGSVDSSQSLSYIVLGYSTVSLHQFSSHWIFEYLPSTDFQLVI